MGLCSALYMGAYSQEDWSDSTHLENSV